MSVSVAPDAASVAREGPSRRTSASFLFSSTTITTWSGRDADATKDGAAEGGAVTGEVVPGAGGGVPDKQATDATAQTVRYTAATARRFIDLHPLHEPGDRSRRLDTVHVPAARGRPWPRRRTDAAAAGAAVSGRR